MASFAKTVAIDDSFDFTAHLRRARLGLAVGLTAIGMVFVSFTSAYIVRQGLPTLEPRTATLVRDWFPVPLPRLLFVNTFILALSSLTMELARRQAARKSLLTMSAPDSDIFASRDKRVSWLAMTLVLGLGFLAGQWMTWRQLAASGFYVSTNPSSSFVYLLTGMHGVHLMGGVLALLVVGILSVVRPMRSRLVAVDVAGWYWHFMAILWIYILGLLEFLR